MPQDPTLTQDGSTTVHLSVETVHAAYCRLWVLPPGANAWEQMREVATGGGFPAEVPYDVTRDTLLGWRLSVGSTTPTSDYRVLLSVRQDGHVVQDGILLIEGTTDAGGQDVDIDHVRLR